jgi:hypothetical protein
MDEQINGEDKHLVLILTSYILEKKEEDSRCQYPIGFIVLEIFLPARR